ncbi:MAG: DUF2147 domain-containing protein [Afipia sp.]|nr:DUF2147 domain-containing protein [Afipia sp.]
MTSRTILRVPFAGLTFASLTFAVLALASSPAFSGDAAGTWLRESGASHVKIAPCGGGALCGTLTWIKPGTDTKAKVGQRIFFDMKPDGTDSWKGSAFNPEDGQTYAGKMSLSGHSLTTAGCAMGGMICKSTSWTRVN